MPNVALHEFIALNREELIRRCRAKVAARSMPPPAESEINHGVPLFLDQLVDALRLGFSSSPQIEKSSTERVVIEVLDECGGLPESGLELFRPFVALPLDGTAGLGLAFSRWAVEANDGRISARNLPDKGCVFTVDLPRLPFIAAA